MALRLRKDSGFSGNGPQARFTEISVTDGMKIFPYEHSSPGDRDETF